MENTILLDLIQKNNAYAVYTASAFVTKRTLEIDRTIPLLIYNISHALCASVKTKLISLYGENKTVSIIDNGNTVLNISLEKINSFDEVLISGSSFINRSRHSFGDMLEVMRQLRDPDGCPWDKAQTHESIRQNLLEEAYELAEAIDLHDGNKMLEESGDVLLQPVFHALISEASNEFTVDDMLSALVHKLITRHTHIFGKNKAANAEEALIFWEKAKTAEKGTTLTSQKARSIPATLPALMRAEKLIHICNKINILSQITSSERPKPDIVDTDSSDTSSMYARKLFDLLTLAVQHNIDMEHSLNALIDNYCDKIYEWENAESDKTE
ncbi:MAG: MazG family protein [Christensenellaceae bacterium]|jgi:tetrapyrrole methylase family protein/MazG family protein|nr:MazG family protein [Christensenellaceae bacterium]